MPLLQVSCVHQQSSFSVRVGTWSWDGTSSVILCRDLCRSNHIFLTFLCILHPSLHQMMMLHEMTHSSIKVKMLMVYIQQKLCPSLGHKEFCHRYIPKGILCPVYIGIPVQIVKWMCIICWDFVGEMEVRFPSCCRALWILFSLKIPCAIL